MTHDDPSPEQHQLLREMLAAHGTGLLDPHEAEQLEAHLTGCEECRRELVEITQLTTMLRGLDLDADGSLPSPPADLTPDLEDEITARLADPGPAREPGRDAEPGLAEVTPIRRRRRRLVTALVAASLLVIGGATGWALAPRPPQVPFEVVAVQVDEQLDPALQVTAGLVPHTWGVEVRMTATGFDAGEHYVVQVIDDTRTRRDAGEFVGTGDQEMVCNLNSSVLRDEATGFVVIDDQQRTVASSTF